MITWNSSHWPRPATQAAIGVDVTKPARTRQGDAGSQQIHGLSSSPSDAPGPRLQPRPGNALVSIPNPALSVHLVVDHDPDPKTVLQLSQHWLRAGVHKRNWSGLVLSPNGSPQSLKHVDPGGRLPRVWRLPSPPLPAADVLKHQIPDRGDRSHRKP